MTVQNGRGIQTMHGVILLPFNMTRQCIILESGEPSGHFGLAVKAPFSTADGLSITVVEFGRVNHILGAFSKD